MTKVIGLEDVDSTQIAARDLFEAGALEDGDCVVAKKQTAGRGRLGRSWLSPEGGLYVSMITTRPCPAARAARVTLATAAGIGDALEALAIDARIKWPNDLVLPVTGPEGKLGPFRKVGGVIVEVLRMSSDQNFVEACSLGIGINVRAPAGGFPADLALIAGSLTDVGFSGSIDDVLSAVRAYVPPALERAQLDFPGVLDTITTRSATLGRIIDIDGKNGIARAFDDDGALLFLDENGNEHVIRAGDVWLSSNGDDVDIDIATVDET